MIFIRFFTFVPHLFTHIGIWKLHRAIQFSADFLGPLLYFLIGFWSYRWPGRCQKCAMLAHDGFFGSGFSYIMCITLFPELFKIIFGTLVLFLFWNVLVLPPHASRQLEWHPKKHQPDFCKIRKTCFGTLHFLCWIFTSIFETLVQTMLGFQLLLTGFGKPWFSWFNTISIGFCWFSS